MWQDEYGLIILPSSIFIPSILLSDGLAVAEIDLLVTVDTTEAGLFEGNFFPNTLEEPCLTSVSNTLLVLNAFDFIVLRRFFALNEIDVNCTMSQLLDEHPWAAEQGQSGTKVGNIFVLHNRKRFLRLHSNLQMPFSMLIIRLFVVV